MPGLSSSNLNYTLKFFTAIYMVMLELYSFLFTTKTYISILNVFLSNPVTHCNRLNQNAQLIYTVDSTFNNYNACIYIMYMHTHIYSDTHAHVCKHIHTYIHSCSTRRQCSTHAVYTHTHIQ